MAHWKELLKNGFDKPGELLQFLEIEHEEVLTDSPFAMRVPRGFAARMQKGNPSDPLLRQVLPLTLENLKHPAFVSDPLQEKKANPVAGLLHKYQGRALLILTGACAVNCRFCFRREFPYHEHRLRPEILERVIHYLKQHPDVVELILSGGDPLILSDEPFHDLLKALETVPALTTLRIHSRIPVVLPERISAEWLAVMRTTKLKKVMVIHTNHPNELDAGVAQSLSQLRQAGFMLLNHTVLLKGINDNVATLAALNRKLFACDVLPYYLNLLDRVQGSRHFEVPYETAKDLMWQLCRQLPGYLIPKLGCEVPGLGCKLSLPFVPETILKDFFDGRAL